MQNYLGAASIDDDTHQTVVTGVGSVYGGLGPYSLDYPFSDWADSILPEATAEVAFGGDLSEAAVNLTTPGFATSYWTFPWEAIPTEGERIEALQAFFDSCPLAELIFSDGFEGGSCARWSWDTGR